MPKLFHQSGAVPTGRFYIERALDREYIEGLRQGAAGPGIGPHLYGSRQSGKTSLLLRAKATLQEDHVVGFVDIQARFSASMVTAGGLSMGEFWERFFRYGIAAELEPDPAHAEAVRGLHASDPADPVGALADLAKRLPRPLILLIDEFDRLGEDYRAEVCRVLRALFQALAEDPSIRINVSLVGVLPPVRCDDSPAAYVGMENVGGVALWVDDFPITDDTAQRLVECFAGHQSTNGFGLDHGKAILAYGGGYPQAVSWLSNVVAEAAAANLIRFDDQSFGQRTRELVTSTLDMSSGDVDKLRLVAHETAWISTLADYFMGHTDAIHLDATADSLKLYEALLEVDADPARHESITYLPEQRAHQTLRFSGLARRDRDGKLRLRAPLFRDALGEAWAARMRKEVYERQMGTYARTRRPHRPGQSRYASDKRLLILATGGTIGMQETPAGRIGLEEAHLPEWTFEVREQLGQLPTVQPLFGLDGADVGPKHWSEIARYILVNQADFDGVVVSCGTDTLAYTASAVAFALGSELHFPVVFTGSQTTTDILHGDSISNMLRACLVATQDLPEVVVTFGEKIFRATRTQKKNDLRFDAFDSPGYPELGFVAEEVQIDQRVLLPKATASAAMTRRSTAFESGILHVSQMPGSEAAFYQAALHARDEAGERLCKGIVIQSLGAGNVPTKDPAYGLIPLIREANELERPIPVILTSQYPVLPANYLRYEPSRAAIEAGAIPTGNMTISAVVTKLSWILPQVDADIEAGILKSEGRLHRIRAMMGEELVGEGGFSLPGVGTSTDPSRTETR